MSPMQLQFYIDVPSNIRYHELITDGGTADRDNLFYIFYFIFYSLYFIFYILCFVTLRGSGQRYADKHKINQNLETKDKC